MATDAQILANRLNAQKSTGPRTIEGKAAVLQNAVKHGLLAERDIISSESQARLRPLSPTNPRRAKPRQPDGIYASLNASLPSPGA